MKKLLLTLMLAVVSSGAMAELEFPVDENSIMLPSPPGAKEPNIINRGEYKASRDMYFAYVKSIRRKGDMVIMGSVLDLKTARKSEHNNKFFLSIVYITLYDCTEKRTRILRTVSTSENLGEGEVIEEIDTPDSKWRSIKSDPLGLKEIWKTACLTEVYKRNK